MRALVVVGGLSGSGKSTVAAALAARTGFVHLNSDVLRKRLAGVAPTERPGAALYTPELNARTYRALYDGAATALADGHGAIIDATFQRHLDRNRARAIAATASVPVLFVECRCDEDELRRRLATRTACGDNPSDADWDVYVRQRGRYEPYDTGDPDHLAVDTTRADVIQTVESRLRAVTS
jgi:predicted kinase